MGCVVQCGAIGWELLGLLSPWAPIHTTGRLREGETKEGMGEHKGSKE